MMRVVTIVGARPQFIKAGAVSRAFAADGRFEEILVHTGQHFDDIMSAVFFRELELPDPSYNLSVQERTHGAMTGRMLEGVETVLQETSPDLVLIYGDTNSTLAGALAASKLHLPVAHVEAGLRSFNRRMPEEINRVVADHLATLQFCPTHAAIENLRAEGITENVFLTGDVMFDATLFAIEAVAGRDDVLRQFGLTKGGYHVCTIHRAENTDDPIQLGAVAAYLRQMAEQTEIVMPLHPRTRKAIQASGIDTGRVRLIDPLGYFDLQALLAGSAGVLTDSGGLQKEAYFHRKSCITLRDETEWVETIEHGWNRLWRAPDRDVPRSDIADYGNGTAAAVIVERIAEYLQ